MDDSRKTKKQLIAELEALRGQVAASKTSDVKASAAAFASLHKTAEAELQRLRTEFDTFFDRTQDMLCVADTDGYFRRLNPPWERVLGYGPHELEGKRFLDFVHPDDLPATLETINDLSQQREVPVFVNRYRCKDGTYRHLEWRSFPVGTTIYAVACDITQRRQAEQQLNDRDVQYRSIVENIADALIIHDTEAVILDVNENACRQFGYDRQELIGMSIPAIESAAMAEHRLDHMTRLLADGHLTFDSEAIRKDGTRFPVSISSTIVTREGRGIVHSFVRDLSERRRADERLRESEELYRVTFENTGSGILLVEEDTTIGLASAEFERLSGYSKEEMEGKKSWTEMVVKEDLERVLAQHRLRRTDREAALRQYECRLVTKSGDIRHIYLTVDVLPGTKRSVAAIVDITERKQAEEALHKSEERFAQVTQQSREIVWEVDSDGLYTYVSHACEEILGYRPDELVGKMRFYDVHPEQGREEFKQAALTVFAAKESFRNFPNKAITKSGHLVWFSTNGVPVLNDDGTLKGYIGSDLDITETRRMTEEWLQSRSNLVTFFDTIDDLLFVLDLHGTILKANRTALRRLKYSEEELVGRSVLMLHSPEQAATVQDALHDALTHGVSRNTIPVITRCGESIWVETHLQRGVWDGLETLFAVSKDISELRLSEERFSKSFHINAAVMALSTVEDGRYVDVNQSFLNTFGFQRDEVIGRTSTELGVWGDGSQRAALIDVLARGDRVREVEVAVKDRYGNPVCGLFSVDHVALQGVPHLLTVMINITDRKRAEEALRWRTAFFEAQVNSSLDGILVVDSQQKRLLTNQRLVEMFKVPRHVLDDPNDAALLEHVVGLTRNPDQFLQKVTYLYDHPGETSRDEIEFADGMVLDRYSSPVLGAEGQYYGRIWTFRDITDRKRSEVRLKTLSSRNEALLASVPDIIMEVDTSRVYTWANKAGYEFFGDDVCGKEAALYFLGEQQTYATVDPLFSGEENVVYVESWQRRRDGQARLLAWWCRVLKDDHGIVTGVLSTARDVTDRKLAEDKLRESEERYRRVFETTLEGIFQTTPDGRYRDANPAFARMLGYDSPQDLKESIADIAGQVYVVAADRDEIKRRLETDGVVMGFETQLRKKDNGIIWVLINSAVQKDSQGQIEYCHGGMIDITDRKRAEVELRENAAVLQSIFQATPAGVGLLVNRIIQKVNVSLCRITGYSETELLGQDMRMLYRNEADYQRISSELYGRMEREGLGILEANLRRKDGSPIDVLLCLSPYDPKNPEAGVTATVLDITERKSAEQGLRDSEEKFRRIAERAFDVILTTRLDGVITYVSPSVRSVFGYAPEEMTGRTMMEFTPESDAGEIIRASAEIADARQIENRRYQLRKKDGSTALVEMNALPVYKDNVVVGGQAILRDITETKRLQELEIRAQRLETAGRIAGQVAHDFNNLLAPLVAYPEFIRDAVPADHPSLAYLDAMESAANKIADINQQLLTLGRRGHYTQEVLDLNAVIRQCLRDIGPLPESLTCQFDPDAELMCTLGGSAQLHRVIMNLLSNARDAMKDSGTITVRTENCYIDDAVVGYSHIPLGEYVKVTISDTGCGIPDSLLPRIFDPFFTTKTTDKQRGTGLGLSVVDAVVKDHGGHVDLSTKVGVGTSFFLYFPITREAIDEPCFARTLGGTESVLVVDDDSIQRDVSARILEKLGYRVSVVSSGEEAVEFLKKRPQDLLILDMVMPSGIDGAETYRQALDVNPGQKAIIVSGFSETDRVLYAQSLGAGAFVRKPVTAKSIAAAVRLELDAKSRRASLP